MVHLASSRSRNPAFVQVLVSQTTVEAFDEAVLHRLARLEGLQHHAVRVRPLVDGFPAKVASVVQRSATRRVLTLTEEAATLEAALALLGVADVPSTNQMLCLGVQHNATLLVTVAENAERLHLESASADMCAVSPICASPEKTTRHRLKPFGDRDANRALHMAVVVPLRYCPETRAYMKRR